MIRYFDAEPYIENNYPFVIIIGGRGIGKTYSTLRTVTEKNIMHMYLRNSDKIMQICSSEMGNPYKAINEDFGTDYQFHMTKDGTAMIQDAKNDNKIVGYGCALSTFSNLRGVSMPEIKVVVYDEFLEIVHGKSKQADWFFNLYETVNRNRELQGKPPLKVIMLANSLSIENAILSEFGIISTIEGMVRSGQRKVSIPEKGIMILLPYLDDLANAKRDTALYRATQDSSYYAMAIENRFTENDFSDIQKKANIYEYIPVCCYCGVYIYNHKSDGTLYACNIYADCPSFDENKRLAFRRRYGAYLKSAIIDGRMKFQNYAAKYLLTDALI